MTPVLGRWNLVSCAVNLHAAPTGLYAIVQSEDGIHCVPLPSEKLWDKTSAGMEFELAFREGEKEFQIA